MSKGSDARIPSKYLSYEKTISDTRTDVIEVRPVTSPNMYMQPSGSNNMLSFNLPNNPEQFLLSDSLYLSGNIQINMTTHDEKDTFAKLKPSISKLFTILRRHSFRVGGQLVDECLNSNINCLHWNVKSNSLEDLQIKPYGEGHAWAGQTAPAYRAFCIPLYLHDSFLFGVPRATKDLNAADVHVIPLWMMAKNQLEIYFDNPMNVVSYDASYTPEGTVFTPSYQLSNLHLETYWLRSPSLSAKVRTQGWAATFRASLPVTIAVQPQLAGTTLSIQIPSSFNSVSHIMAVIQRPGDLIDLSVLNRKFLGSPELGIPTSTQVRVNSIQVFQEPLGNNGSDLQRELNKIHPESRTSSFIMNSGYACVNGDATSEHLIYGLKVGRDYEGDSGGLLSGYRTDAAVGSIVVEFQFSKPIETASVFNAFVTYARYIQVVPNGAISVKY
jgi:hypothetical protein